MTVAAAVVVREGRVLLTRRKSGDRFEGQWEFPGGKVDFGEAPDRALLRELQEEIGVEGRILAPYQFAYHEYERKAGDPRGPLRVLLLFFLAAVVGEPQALEVAECRWVPVEEISKMDILKGDGPVIERLLQDHRRNSLG